MTEQLIHRIIRKDSKAEYAFYRKFAPGLFTLVFRYVCNKQDAGSIVNTGFYKIFKNLSAFTWSDEAGLRAWMKRIVINEALMHLRSQKSFLSTEDIPVQSSSSLLHADEDLHVEDYYRLIQELPDDIRTVFNLFAIDGYTHKEIAGQLGIGESSSRVYLSRARQLLRNKLNRNG